MSSLIPSRYQLFIGILADSTIEKNQRWFHVYIPELLPFQRGDVSPTGATTPVTVHNILTDTDETTEVNLVSTVHAEYFGTNTSMDVPTMNRGMQVLVFNYAHTDNWYWIPLERDDCYKTFEHVRIRCADIAMTNKLEESPPLGDNEERAKALTDDNCYFFEIDTKYSKKVRISTAATDGEKFRYYFEIDPSLQAITLTDESVDKSQPPNKLTIESKPGGTTLGRITMQNAAGTTIAMVGPDMIINVPGNLTFNIGGDTAFANEGNVTSTINGNRISAVAGNESQRVDGATARTFHNDVIDTYSTNLTETIAAAHSETQSSRTTVTEASSWKSSAWSLQSNMLNIDSQQSIINSNITNITCLDLTLTSTGNVSITSVNTSLTQGAFTMTSGIYTNIFGSLGGCTLLSLI